jgi:small subunit ribosomal protein S17e
MIVLKDNKAKFGVDFNENKKMLDSLSTITSKALRNRVAGYITRLLKNESIELEKVENMKKQEQVEDQNEPEDLVTESVSEEAPLTETS